GGPAQTACRVLRQGDVSPRPGLPARIAYACPSRCVLGRLVDVDHEGQLGLGRRECPLEELLELVPVARDPHERDHGGDLLVEVRVSRLWRQVLVMLARPVPVLVLRVHPLELGEHARRKLLVDVVLDQLAYVGSALRGAGPELPTMEPVDLAEELIRESL